MGNSASPAQDSQKIKEAILHPDLDIRDTAIRYFCISSNP